MAQIENICDIDPALIEDLKKFRFKRSEGNRAIVMKICSEQGENTVKLDEQHEDISIDDLAEEIPTHLPRYVALTYVYTHDDGRKSYPLCFIFISPRGVKPEMHMMYAGTKNSVVKAGGFTKVFELRSAEELTEEWLREKLGFFR